MAILHRMSRPEARKRNKLDLLCIPRATPLRGLLSGATTSIPHYSQSMHGIITVTLLSSWEDTHTGALKVDSLLLAAWANPR